MCRRAGGADAGRADRDPRAGARRRASCRAGPLTMDSRPLQLPTSTAHPRGWVSARHLAAWVFLPAVTTAVVVIGLRANVPGGIAAVDVAAFGITLIWALAGAIAARDLGRSSHWQLASGALVGAVALTAGRIADQTPTGQHAAARAIATVAAPLVIAISLHFLIALPDGRLTGQARRAAVGIAYATALGPGLALAVAREPFPAVAVALIWPLAVLAALPAARGRYFAAAGRDRERMQWLAIGSVVAADVALFSAVLHLLVGWPGPVAAVAVGAVAALPLGLMAGEVSRLAPHGGRVLVHAVSAAGSTAVVAVIYVVIVLGLGKAPDEALRTFGSRMTRAVAMDELLLQLAESLRKTMRLTSAEIYTGSGDVLERAVSVPDVARKPVLLTDRERRVVARAGVSGSAWASVWLPSLLDGREQAQLRVAPISHAGELLGLIVVARPAREDAFSEEDDRVLTELARQAGLAFHNVQLDAALQTTLDELRRQAAELRESRARIVASGDAERRRVERDLHDGAQQHLVALAISLRLAADIAADEPAAVAEMLAQMAADVQVTITELRELAHGIYPPLLADSGLGEALRAAASRNPLPATVVVADDVGRYPSEVEAAVYFCCLEALQNAAKHAKDATVELRLWTESGGLLFSVADDGPGFDPSTARGGHGFVNMADRLGAIGGAVRWDSRPGHGAKISGSVPLV